MKDFIGNPFEQEYENEDELDEFEIGVGDFLFENTPNPLIVAPPYEVEEDEESQDVIFDTADDDVDDSDFDFFQDNDGYDSDHGNFEFSSDDGGPLDDTPHYNLRFSIDDDEDDEDDDLDYVTFPVSDGPETSPKSSSTESSNTSSSNTSSSDQELEYQNEDT